MRDKLAYLDEFGTNSLDVSLKDVSTHFIVTAIIIDSAEKVKIEQQLEQVRQRHFQKGEMKSRNVSTNDARRIKILNDLIPINFFIYGLVVDKRLLFSQGLQHKASFYKFINGLLYRDLYKIYPDLQLHADQSGTLEYMQSFSNYVNKRHIPSLFSKAFFQFLVSDSNLLVQTADIISGTLSRCFDEKLMSVRKSEFLDVLRAKILTIKLWPASFEPFKPIDLAEEGKYDPIIGELGLNLAITVREKLQKLKDEQTKMQMISLNHLLFHFQHISPSKFVWQKELIENLENQINRKINKRYFMSEIIGPLRNMGVIISSSSKGYKLPANEKDLYTFLKHSNSIIKPMIDRIQICRDSIKAATMNKLDIVSHDEFKFIRKALE